MGHLHGKMTGQVSEKVVFKQEWSLVRNSTTWKHEGTGVREVVFKQEWSLVKDLFTWKYEEKGFTKGSFRLLHHQTFGIHFWMLIQ